MFDKLKSFYTLFQVGKEVVDPAKWKAHQITTTMLGALFIAVTVVLKGFGYELPIDQDTSTTIAAGVIAIVNVVLTLTTSKKVGLPAKPEQDPLPVIQPSLAEAPKPVQPVSSSAIAEGLAALYRDRGRANVDSSFRDKPIIEGNPDRNI